MMHSTNSKFLSRSASSKSHKSKSRSKVAYTPLPTPIDEPSSSYQTYNENHQDHSYAYPNLDSSQIPFEGDPVDTHTITRRKSILKIPKMEITWDQPQPQAQHPVSRPTTPTSVYSVNTDPNAPRKLHKQPKAVRFTPSTAGSGTGGYIDSYGYGYAPGAGTGLPTPDSTPEKGKKGKSILQSTNDHQNSQVKKKSSWIHWPFRVTNSDNPPRQLPSFVPAPQRSDAFHRCVPAPKL